MSDWWAMPGSPGNAEFDTILTNASSSTTNLLKQSQTLDQSPWIAALQADFPVTANQATAPDSTLTMDELKDNNAGGTGIVLVSQSYLTMSTSTNHVYSGYFKANGASDVLIGIGNIGALSVNAYFDLAAGTAGTKAADVTDHGIIDVGDGIYRCWISFLSDALDGVVDLQIFVAEGEDVVNVPLDGTSSIYCWGMQLEESSTLSIYVPTTTTSATQAGITLSGNYQDDVHAALEHLTGTTGSMDDLYKRYKLSS